MHQSAIENADLFFATYAPLCEGKTVVEIGALDVNGSLRQICPPGARYVGVDLGPGRGVEVVLEDLYTLPFADDSVDICLSSSVFEHSEMFWLLFVEILRILKPGGLFYLNAPSNGDFHRYPVDCWRFYPDCGQALVAWARRCGITATLLESFVAAQRDDVWNDFVAVFAKGEAVCDANFRSMIGVRQKGFYNGRVLGQDGFVNFRAEPEDRLKLLTIEQIAAGKLRVS